jgi:hypothetical protein
MKLWMILFYVVGLAFSPYGIADICKNANGGISIVNYDLTTTLNTNQNIKGGSTELEKIRMCRLTPPVHRVSGKNAPIAPI